MSDNSSAAGAATVVVGMGIVFWIALGIAMALIAIVIGALLITGLMGYAVYSNVQKAAELNRSGNSTPQEILFTSLVMGLLGGIFVGLYAKSNMPPPGLKPHGAYIVCYVLIIFGAFYAPIFCFFANRSTGWFAALASPLLGATLGGWAAILAAQI